MSADAGDGVDGKVQLVQGFLATSEGLSLAGTFAKIPDGRLRRQVLELVRAMADD